MIVQSMKGQFLNETEILNAVQNQIDRSQSFMENRISYERALAYDYYYGREFGNEVEGRSKVISQDVSQVVDSAVPALVKIFVGGDKAVEFTPRGPEDVESAELATVGCNYVFFTQNNGYSLAHDFIKDGLLQKVGAFSWYWDEEEVTKKQTLNGLDDMQFQMLVQQVEEQKAEIVGHDAQEIDQAGQLMTMHNVAIEYKKKQGKVKICVVPPEEVLISPDAMGLDVYEMPFIAHAPLLTASDLREMGIKQDVIDSLPTGDRDSFLDDERIARRSRLDANFQFLDQEAATSDQSQKLYRFYRCYMKLDANGDGIAERVEIWIVGSTILKQEDVDHIPMCLWTPKVMPHEVVGISLADDVMDIQLLKSTLWRCALDNFYMTTSPRLYVNRNAHIDLDQVLTIRPGGIVEGDGPGGIEPLVVPFTAQHAFQALEYADQEEEVRTGISRLFQGIDPQAINKTATGVNALINQANARVELMARNAAEYGFKPLFKGIMYLLSKHQQDELLVRLANKFTPIDPETWSKEYDMTVNVGLGTGTKEQQAMQLQQIMMVQAQMAQSPAGTMFPPTVWYQKVYNAAAKIAEAAGFKDPSQYFPDPQEAQEPPPPGPPPEVQKAQMQIEADKEKHAADMQMKGQENEMNAQLDMQKSQMELQNQTQLEHLKIQSQEKIEMFKAQMQKDVEIFKAQLQAQVSAMVGMKQAENQPETENG